MYLLSHITELLLSSKAASWHDLSQGLLFGSKYTMNLQIVECNILATAEMLHLSRLE